MSIDRRPNFPHNSPQFEAVGCLMHSHRNGPDSLLQRRDIEKIGGSTYAEIEERDLRLTGFRVYDEYRMLAQYRDIGGFGVTMTMVDAYDEASRYPQESETHKFFSARVKMGDGTYIRFDSPDIRTSEYNGDLEVVTQSPHRVGRLKERKHYYDVISNPCDGNATIKIGRMFDPFYVSSGKQVKHPRTGRSFISEYNTKGYHLSNELLLATDGRHEITFPRRSFHTAFNLPNGETKSHTDADFIGHERFDPGARFSFRWQDPLGYVLSTKGEDVQLILENTADSVRVIRDNAISVVMPKISRLPLLPLEADDDPMSFFEKYARYVGDEIIPNIVLDQNTIDLSKLNG